MKNSTYFKKIIALVLVVLLAVNTVVFPVSAKGQAGDWGDDSYHEEYEDFSDCPKYTSNDLVYTGVVSQNVTKDFNMIQQFGMDWTKSSGFYMSRPFQYRTRWDYPSSVMLNLGEKDSAYNKMFQKEKFDTIANSSFVTSSNIKISDYDVYYVVQTNYSVTREYGYLTIDYWFIPKGQRVALSNQNNPENSTNYSEIYYGLWLDSSDSSSNSYSNCWHYSFCINGETKSVQDYKRGFAQNYFVSFLGMAHNNIVATNIPIFSKKDVAENYIKSGQLTEDPTNKCPEESGLDNNKKLSANSFGWDSFKCRLSQSNNSYRFIYDYKYSSPEMIKDPSSFYMDIEYSQVIRYRNRVNMGAYEDATSRKQSRILVNSSGSATDSIVVIDSKGNWGEQFQYFVCLLMDEASSFFGSGTKLTDIDIYSSNIYVTVKLRHKRILSDNPIVDSVNQILSDLSSDVRTFKFDALTLDSLDNPEEIQSDVITKDATDSEGNVITDSTGKPVKEVSQIITNDNSTHTTINNYYYNSDGQQTTGDGGSSIGDSLSDIASGLIKFIKTLVTEGLPAALEILKSLIKSITDLVGFLGSQIGDVGAGTQNGIIAILKAIPVPLWGICSVGLIVFVVVGVLKKIF